MPIGAEMGEEKEKRPQREGRKKGVDGLKNVNRT